MLVENRIFRVNEMPTKKIIIESTDEAWESGDLGQDEEFVRVSKTIKQADVDKSVGLKPISIRLQECMIEDLKLIAGIHGLGYQPLMRQILRRFVDCEKKRIMREYVAEQKMANKKAKESEPPRRKSA